jgi:hypothetical protein
VYVGDEKDSDEAGKEFIKYNVVGNILISLREDLKRRH